MELTTKRKPLRAPSDHRPSATDALLPLTKPLRTVQQEQQLEARNPRKALVVPRAQEDKEIDHLLQCLMATKWQQMVRALPKSATPATDAVTKTPTVMPPRSSSQLKARTKANKVAKK